MIHYAKAKEEESMFIITNSGCIKAEEDRRLRRKI